MYLDLNTPILRKIEFILSSTLTYFFDVNQNITILSLKKIVASAARLRKYSFRIYNNNIDYTEYDNSTLLELFPDQHHIIFTIQHTEDETLLPEDTFMKLNVNLYCQHHESKYLNYYCYSCKQSVCSKCIFDNKHKGHQYMEKTDYLQSSKILVNKAFKENKIFNNNNPQTLLCKQNYLTNTLENKLLFKPIYDMIKEIEVALNDLIVYYNKVNKDSFNMFNDNVLLSKTYCVQGLDNLKQAINIADIIIDENVFLSFDHKYRNLLNETETQIKDDIKKFNILNNELSRSVEQFVQHEYQDILNYLQNKLNNIKVSQLYNKINETIINELSQQGVVDSLMKGIDLNLTFNGDRKDILQTTSNSHKINDNIIKHLHSKDKATTSYFQNSTISHLMFPLKDTNIIKVYKSDSSYENKYIQFPQVLNMNKFLLGSAHCNYNGLLYISGGFINDDKTISSNAFFSYDYNSNSLIYLSGMISPHSNHSMIGHGSYIYIIGGNQNKSCERYNIKTKQFSAIPNLNKEHEFPIVSIYHNILYVMFGKSNINKHSIEAIDLNGLSHWEKIHFNNIDNINTNIYGSAVISLDNTLVCFGGFQQGTIINKAFIFNVDDSTLKTGDDDLQFMEYFSENQLFRMNDYYVQISERNFMLIPILIDNIYSMLST